LRKVVLWTDRHGAGQAEFAGLPFDPFFNINTPEDIAEAERLVAASE
jgi:molybdopterin-guanine dinucleotide biosynthesis protein A